MFRLTRGMQVQHIQFPLPVIRIPLDLDETDASDGREAPAADATPAAVVSEDASKRVDG